MLLNFAILLLLALAAHLGLQRKMFALPALSEDRRRVVVLVVCLALPASLIAREAIDAFIFALQPPRLARSDFPYRVIFDLRAANSNLASNLAIVLSVLQSLLVGALVYALSGSRRDLVKSVAIALAFAAMVTISLAATTIKSADLYAYVGYANLGLAAYQPPAVPFVREEHAINFFWGTPMAQCVYGPVFVALASAATQHATSLGEKLLALRWLDVCALAVCAAFIARSKRERLAVVAFALNPAIFEQFVIDGHNDLIATAFLLGAVALRTPYLRVILIALAICVKLPFVLIGAFVFGDEENVWRRFCFTAAAILLGVETTAVLAGPSFVGALESAMAHGPTLVKSVVFAHLANVIAAIAVIFGALVLRRYSPGGALPFAGLGVSPFPWYTIWGVPYAMRAGFLVPLLVALPMLTGALSSTYEPTPFRKVLVIIALLGTLGFAFVSFSRSRAAEMTFETDKRLNPP